MASNDSGVDTSNDSSCTNDNSNGNSNSNNTSINYVLVPPSDNATNAEVLDGLRQVAQKLSVLQATMPEGTSTYKIPSTHIHINKMPQNRTKSHKVSAAKSIRNQLEHRLPYRLQGFERRDALIPYVCTVPNERKLRLAASVSNVELLVRLLDSGVNPNTSDEHQRSPLHLAASRGYKDVVKVLLSRGANPNRQDSLGNTPLHLAVCSASSYNFNMVVRILLQNGARVNILDRTGKTPLDLAKSKLMLMRSRLGCGATPESAKLFVEMSMLTGLLHKTLNQQLKDVEQFDDLEARLRNLTTKEIEDGADNLLTDVAGLTLN